jgi:hypothetical protein
MTSDRIGPELFKRISKDRNFFTFFFLSIFFSLGLIGLLNHAMWRDELTIWLIARDSESISDLFRIIRYEPHPALWYLCVSLLYRISHNPVMMQIFHLGLGTGGAYLFLRHSPFKPLQKVLFIFGYLPFYEYLIISRNYSLGILFAFAFCAGYETRKKSYLWLALFLFLMANSNAYSLFIAFALGLTLIVEYAFRERLGYRTRASLRNQLMSLAIFILGLMSSIAFLIPPTDNVENGGLARGWMLTFDLRHFFTALARLWNSYVVVIVAGDSKYYSVIICGVLSLVIIAFFTASLAQKYLALFFYGTATLEILLFTYVKFLGAQRHFGHLYMVLIIAFWLASYYPNSNALWHSMTQGINRFQSRSARSLEPRSAIDSSPIFNFTSERSIQNPLERPAKTLLTILLYAQLVGGAIAFSRDLVIPYSASKATAHYIQAHHLDRLSIAGSQDIAMAPVSGYLGQKIYYPERRGLGSFVLFNSTRTEVNADEVLQQVSHLLNKRQSQILLILNYELKTARDDLLISPLAEFTNSLIYNEKYYLYRVESYSSLS